MESDQHRFLETLPGTAETYVVAAVATLAIVLTGLFLIAVAIRHEDAEIGVGSRAPGPFTRAVRRMLGLHVCSGGDFPYGDPMRDSGAVDLAAPGHATYGLPDDPRTYEALPSYLWASSAAPQNGNVTCPGSSRDEVARLLASLAPETRPGQQLVLAAVVTNAPRRTKVLAWIPLDEYMHTREPPGYHGPAQRER